MGHGTLSNVRDKRDLVFFLSDQKRDALLLVRKISRSPIT